MSHMSHYEILRTRKRKRRRRKKEVSTVPLTVILNKLSVSGTAIYENSNSEFYFVVLKGAAPMSDTTERV